MEEYKLEPAAVHFLTKDQAWHYRVLPQRFDNGVLNCFCPEGMEQETLRDELEVLLNLEISFRAISEQEITRLLGTHYFKDNTTGGGSTQLYIGKNSDEFLDKVIAEAKNLKSSDIHIESYENKCRLRVRIDGLMVERYLLKREDYPALINKVKIMANLDIAEKRLPQDGRMNFKHEDTVFDIRVSILPTLFGEKVVLRLLSNDAANIQLDVLGFSEYDLDNYMQGIKRPSGILLISGPTGSGKTTTLYATLKLLNQETRNVLTIEDPVEYTLEGINQVQLKENIGLGFAAALRTFLRQDPDVIMVGEIRDVETANMAIRAALTGHLVLSTIHTNSAWGTVSRLIDMGVPAFLLASTLNTTVAQRLIRLLCPACKAEIPLDEKVYPRQFKPYAKVNTHYIAKGCESCYYTGYKGRKAVYEVIPVDQELSLAIKNGNLHIQDLLSERKIRSLAENAFDLFKAGLTTADEIYPLLFNY